MGMENAQELAGITSTTSNMKSGKLLFSLFDCQVHVTCPHRGFVLTTSRLEEGALTKWLASDEFE
jgi:hypothetical protein